MRASHATRQLAEYYLGDFVIRVGTTMLPSGVRRGVVLEVEYRPLQSLQEATAVLSEMVRLVLPPSIKLEDPQLPRSAQALAPYRLDPAAFSQRHVVAQYLTVLAAEGLAGAS